MKTRIVMHIALNAKNQRVGSAVSASGVLIPFGGHLSPDWKHYKATDWLFGFAAMESLAYWKSYAKSCGAVRFQRVILEGETA